MQSRHMHREASQQNFRSGRQETRQIDLPETVQSLDTFSVQKITLTTSDYKI